MSNTGVASAMGTSQPEPPTKVEKKPIKFSNLLLGSGLNMFEVSTLGQVSCDPLSEQHCPHYETADLRVSANTNHEATGSHQDNNGRKPWRWHGRRNIPNMVERWCLWLYVLSRTPSSF